MKQSLTDITGIGPATADILSQHGFSNIELIARATVIELITVPGFSEIRANSVIQHAQSLLPVVENVPEKVLSKTEKVKKVKKDKKLSKDKKVTSKKDKGSKEKKEIKKRDKSDKAKKTKKAKKK
jgi:hypothetical protein